jgi:hypothetical protein
MSAPPMVVLNRSSIRSGLPALALSVTVLVAGCGDHAGTVAEIEPSPGSTPDLSAPQRFRPGLGGVTVSSTTVKVGEVAVIEAEVHAVPGTSVEWIVLVEDASKGNGTLEPRYGTGNLRTEFRPNYPGEVSLFLYAADSRGVPAVPQRVRLAVVP